MIEYFNIPRSALVNSNLSKAEFERGTVLAAADKRLLRSDIDKITLWAMIQNRNTGVAEYEDNEYKYVQILFMEVAIKNLSRANAVATMIQKSIPSPLFLIVSAGESYSVNWCKKRLNQSDSNKSVIEEIRSTPIFLIDPNDEKVSSWLNTLDVTALKAENMKSLFEQMGERLMMLEVHLEAGCFVNANLMENSAPYHEILERLKNNRSMQQKLVRQLKEETQNNQKMKLTMSLRALQDEEREWRERIQVN